jgi:hypothetical protein
LAIVAFLAGRAYQRWRPGPSAVTVMRGEAMLVVGLDGDQVRTISFEHGQRRSGRPIDPFFTQNFQVGDVDWFGDGAWHETGVPTCLSGDGPAIVEVGVVQARTFEDAPGRVLLSWLRCFPN